MKPSASKSILRYLTRAVFVVALASGFAMPAPAHAIPDEDPCAATANIFCRIAPIAPGLTGDVDLTGQYPNALQENETQTPTDICAKGCS